MNLDELYRWLQRSPRNRALEALILLAVLYWLPLFWLMERTVWRAKDENKI